MKLAKIILVILVVLGLMAWGIGAYLSPDDLKHCGASPQEMTSTSDKCRPADAIVAVSGGDTLARADEAIKLYKAGWSNVIIFSGAAADKSGPSNAEVMEQRAIAAGVDPTSIITENVSENTSENATETNVILKNDNIKSVILVTSAYHQRRALIEFNRNTPGVDVRAHPVARDKQWNEWWWLTPTGWWLAIRELVSSLILSTGGVDRT